MPIPRSTRLLLITHSAYLLFGGGWPLLSLATFEAVTGPKEEDWLVRSVALLLVVAGIILLRQRTAPIERSAVELALGTSLSLGAVAVISAAGGWVSPVYFADGTMHLLFAGAWAVLLGMKQVPFRSAER